MTHSILQWLSPRASTGFRGRRHKSRKNHRQLSLELLESRDLPSVMAHPNFLIEAHASGVKPFAGGGSTWYSPSQIRHAYGFDQITFSNGTVTGDGTGTTIAIVDAYDDPTIAADLHNFDVQFGLTDPVFTKVNENGGSSLPSANVGWSEEISLDVEWAHAIAPGANILLVEANSASFGDLLTAVNYAANKSGVVAVSMSWGGGEFFGENGYDGYFQTPSGHAGVTFIASSGDSGAPDSYPSASPNVLSVGGTTLNLDGSNNISSETGWSGSGGGLSAVESQPAYQNGVVTQSTTARANPDVSYDADPNTGFPVDDSYAFGASTPWAIFGGTSDAAPQWAGLVAIADQGRALAGLGSLDGRTQTLPDLYAMPASNFHDITSGTSTGSPNLSAGAGYDLVTGRGTPAANLIVASLVGQGQTGSTHFSVSAPASSTAGGSFAVTVTALDANNQTVTNYAGTVHFSSSDSIAGLPSDYPFTSTDAGSHTFTVTLKTAGNDTVTAADKANGSINGNATVAVSPAAANKLAFGQQPGNTVIATSISPAVTVQVQDTYGNVITSDSTDQVTVAIGTNPGGGTLSGTTTVTVTNGVATFSNLSINQLGNGYTLTATSGILTSATSAAFNITTASSLIEGFETSDTWNIVGGRRATAFLSTAAAHDGNWGLDDYNGNDWIYRNDAAAHVKAGDTLSVWLQFSGSADGRAYFGFGASASGTLSLVAAPNTGQLMLQSNAGYGFTNLAAVSQTYQANHWYRLEVAWGTSGKIIGRLYDSNGTTLLNTLTATTTSIKSGGIAFRATGSDKFWDTVTDTSGVNNFSLGGGTGGSSTRGTVGFLAFGDTGTTLGSGLTAFGFTSVSATGATFFNPFVPQLSATGAGYVRGNPGGLGPATGHTGALEEYFASSWSASEQPQAWLEEGTVFSSVLGGLE
jgi:hypothetical protein